MEAADVLYGVTMQEDGVSKILRLDLENVSADLISYSKGGTAMGFFDIF